MVHTHKEKLEIILKYKLLIVDSNNYNLIIIHNKRKYLLKLYLNLVVIDNKTYNN
jgi:hypothetical protein